MSCSPNNCSDCIRRIADGEGLCPWHAVPVLEMRIAELEGLARRLSFEAGHACPFCGWDEGQCECKGQASPTGSTTKP